MSTDDKTSPRTATEAAKQRARSAAPMPPPQMQQVDPAAYQHPNQQGYAQGPPQGQPYPGQQGYTIQPPPPEQVQGVPMGQIPVAAQSQQQQQPAKRSPQEIAADFQALQDAQRRQAEQDAAAHSGQKSQDDVEDEPKERPPLLRSTDKDMEAALDHFNNKARRRRIEATLEPVNVQDIILHRELRQEVTLSLGIKVVFRTLNGHDSQAVLAEVGRISVQEVVSDLYLQETMALLNLACGIRSVGDIDLPNHLKDKKVDPAALRQKLDTILDWPVQVLADMRVNYYWFDDRVRNVMVEEQLGNG